MPRKSSGSASRRSRCSGPKARGAHDGHSQSLVSGSGILEGRSDANQRCRLELRSRRAPSESRGIRRVARRDSKASRWRPRPRDSHARALREHSESADAALRRIGSVGSVAERVSREPSGKRPVQPVSDRFFYWLRATMLETRRLGYWWANRMLQTSHPVEQKMALLWHGHFATHENKVRDYRKMLQQIELFEKGATANIR